MVSAFTAACSFQRLDLALVNPGIVQTILVNDVIAAGGTAEEWLDGDVTTVRGAEKLRDWIMIKSPRIVWFGCPTENSTPSENGHLTAAQSRSRFQSRGTWHPASHANLASDMASSGQCDFVLEIPKNSRAVRFGGCNHERLKGFHCAWVRACAWSLRTDSIGYAEGGWRVVTSKRSVADLLVSRSCNETHWHRSVECTFPPAASLSHLCRRLMPIVLRRPLLWSLRSWLQEQPPNDDFGANRQFRDALPRNSHCLVTVCLHHQIHQQRQSQTWKSIRLCRRERNHGVL